MSTILKGPEWKLLLSELEGHFAIFGSLYSIARPSFSEELPTAGVYFNRAGNCVDFKINPTFWAKLSFEEKLFVMSHEALHVFLRHGVRIRSLEMKERENANKALDVVVNHLLVDKFDFDRAKCDPHNQWCWLDTVFKGRADVKANQNYEYYLNLMRQKGGGGNGKGGEGGGEALNDHSGLESFGGESDSDKEGKPKSGKGKPSASAPQPSVVEKDAKAFKDLLKQFGSGELEELAKKLEGSPAGDSAGDLVKTIAEMRIPPKRKWETVIKQWSKRFMAEADDDQFVTPNRRYALFKSDDTFLPTAQEREAFDKNRIDVWFFQDTSGSCAHLAERLFNAGKSLPPQRFNVKFHCFDTEVYEVDPAKRELKGFGGTSFSCIETYIQRRLAEKPERYPEAVFCLTDGYGDSVQPERPERWHWFLTDNARYYIPPKSVTHMLEDYE